MTIPPSGSPLAMADFFALEAGEYLERLDALLAPETAPPADEFVRLARALRGSALMASQQAIARAASGLETLARGLREGRRGWDTATRQLAIQAVDDLKIFVRKAGSWTDADTTKAEQLATQLEQQSGRASAQIRAVEALGLDAGARAFVAREGAAIASALDRAATALRSGAPAKDPLHNVLKAIQPLRGLAALNDLPPLPEVLEGIEQSINQAAHQPGAGDLFRAAAAAIAQAAREVAERGRPDAEGATFRAFATELGRFLQGEPSVIPITDLYYDDQGPHIVQRGTAAEPPPLNRVALVSHGEHLRLAADALESAPSATQRELRAHTLAGTFRALPATGEGPIGEGLGRFVQAARDAVASGLALREPARFAAALRRAGEWLAGATGADNYTLGAGLAAVAAELVTMGGAVSSPVFARPEGRRAGDIVPIESLAPSPAVPPEPPAPREPRPSASSVSETNDFVGSWAAYERMVGAGIGPASLDELLGRAAVPAAPSLDTTRVAATPVAPAPPPRAPAVPALEVVDIKHLVYRGQRALARAQELRQQARHLRPDQLGPLFDEVCDLVVLALESD